MRRSQPYIPALILFCLALLVRIVYNLTVGQGYVPEYDAGYYHTIALHLLNEHCFCLYPHISTTDRAPLWPFIITIIYGLLGPVNLYARLFFSLIGSGTCVLVYLFARDIFGRRIAIVAGVIAAFYPGLYIYDGWLYSESLYTFLLLAFAYTLYLLQCTAKPRWMILSGISLALASLTRPNGLFFLGIVIVWVLIVGCTHILSWRIVGKSVLIITLLTFGLLLPWTLRNYQVSHTLIPVATGSDIVLLGAYNDTILTSVHDRGMWVAPDAVRPPLGRGEARQGYVTNWIHSHLSDMPYLLSLHLMNMWRPITPEAGLPVNQFPDRPSSRIVWWMMQFTPIPIFILATLGLLITWRRWQQLLSIYLVILLTIAQCIVFYGSSRFRAPIEPLLVLLATGAIWWLTENAPGTLHWRLGKQSHASPTPIDEPIRSDNSSIESGETETIPRLSPLPQRPPAQQHPLH